MKKIIPKEAVLVPDNAGRVFQGMIFDVYQWPQKLFDGSEHTFEMLKRTDTVSVICIVDGKILVVDDEQPHLGARKSFPGGRVDAEDSSVIDAAKREIREETGYSFENWKLIQVRQPYRKIEWFVYVFVAWEPTGQREPALDPGEKIDVSELSFADLQWMVFDDVGYLGESRDVLKNIESVDDLLKLPDFEGQEVDR
ncbi:MAG TPA: NUDIX hydrolase [Candidatus Saccharimonadia bacterium]|nr:NUDIX hydrolase [Candidatus Saccharimonadia bacterium]